MGHARDRPGIGADDESVNVILEARHKVFLTKKMTSMDDIHYEERLSFLAHDLSARGHPSA